MFDCKRGTNKSSSQLHPFFLAYKVWLPPIWIFGSDMDGEEEYRELSAFLGSQRMQYDELRHVYDEKTSAEDEVECKHLQNLSSHNDGQR